MADILTLWNPTSGSGDWVLSPGTVQTLNAAGVPITDANNVTVVTGIDTGGIVVVGSFGVYSGHDLETAVILSLFSDAEASADDLGGDVTADPRGWWADDRKALGSKLWLRMRSKATAQTLLLVKNDIAAALQWLIDDGVTAAIDVTTEYSAPGMLGARVTLHRANGATASLAFDWAWKGL